jgi:hypothetical protein
MASDPEYEFYKKVSSDVKCHRKENVLAENENKNRKKRRKNYL